MVEYALLLGLIGILSIAAVGFFGSSISGLFNHEANCLGGQSNSNQQTSLSQLTQANSLGSTNSDGDSSGISLSSYNSSQQSFVHSSDNVEGATFNLASESGSGGNNQLSTGLQINNGQNPPSSAGCGTSANSNNDNQQSVLNLLR
jgi:Flp pilus assembly pilin Flp